MQQHSDVRPSRFFILMAQYNSAVIPLSIVARDYFTHLTEPKLVRKTLAGEIQLPISRMERSQKLVRGVHISDLAHYIDEQRAKALKR